MAFRPILCAVAVLSLLACDGTETPSPGLETADAPPPRNVLLITVDTLRADALGFAGNGRVRTPTLDALAEGGRVFPRAHAHNVVTLPSHANILTGLYPFQHGVRNNGGFTLGSEPPTIASLLEESGFATGAVVGAFPLDSRFGLDRGFEVYDDDLGGSGGVFRYAERRGDEVVARARRWWAENRDRRRFLWLHLFDPHAPYEAPEPFASRASNPYLGEVEAVDAYLAPFLSPFLEGEEEPTLIAFTSDHGEALGAHGEETHGFFAYEDTLRVPLVLWGPGIEPSRDPREAQHVDLLPTLLGSLGLPIPTGLPGRSLLDAPGADRATYFESLSPFFDLGVAPLRGILRQGRKAIDVPLPELYDLEADPDETENLVDEERARFRSLRSELEAEDVWPPESGAVAPEERERLRSLGYLGGTGPERRTFGPEDDPKNRIDLRVLLNRVATLQSRGDPEAALDLGGEMLDRHPTVPAVYEYLVKIHLDRGDHAAAVSLLQRAREHGAADSGLLQQLARSLVRIHRPREALEVVRRVDPAAREPAILQEAALALTHLGRTDEALSALEEYLGESPRDAAAWETLSYVALQAGARERARRAAARAVEIDPTRADAWNNLGVASYGLDRPAEAIEAWRRAATLDPDNPDTLFNLGLVSAESGDPQTAVRSLRRFLEIATAPDLEEQRRVARELLSRLRERAGE